MSLGHDLYLFILRFMHSVVCNTLPSAVTAANTVDEYGAQATSPTELFKSKVKRGFL